MKYCETLTNLSWGTFFKMIGSMVFTSPNHTSGMYKAQTTWHQAVKEIKGIIYFNEGSQNVNP